MSYAATGKHVCPVCGTLHNSGEVLLHKQLKDIKEKDRVTGVAMCPEHLKLFNEGYVALVELARTPRGDEHPLFDVPRTGQLAHVRASVWATICDRPTPKGVAVVEVGVIEKLKGMVTDEVPGTERGSEEPSAAVRGA